MLFTIMWCVRISSLIITKYHSMQNAHIYQILLLLQQTLLLDPKNIPNNSYLNALGLSNRYWYDICVWYFSPYWLSMKVNWRMLCDDTFYVYFLLYMIYGSCTRGVCCFSYGVSSLLFTIKTHFVSLQSTLNLYIINTKSRNIYEIINSIK